MSNALAKVAAKFRDAFHYNPGHSDLDREQPITVHVTLGDWRDLNYLLNREQVPYDGVANRAQFEAECAHIDPRGLFEVLNDALKDDGQGGVDAVLDNNPGELIELLDTGSVTLQLLGEPWVLTLHVAKEG